MPELREREKNQKKEIADEEKDGDDDEDWLID